MDRNELYHYGVLGMKWGVCRKRSNGVFIGKNRSRKAIESDLNTLDNGGHFKRGLTKKRQAKFDEADRKDLQSRLDTLEGSKRVSKGKRAAKIALAGIGATGLAIASLPIVTIGAKVSAEIWKYAMK